MTQAKTIFANRATGFTVRGHTRELAARGYFVVCLAVGSLLRAARYSRVQMGTGDVRKQRRFHAPLLIWLSGPLMKVLDTGVRVLPSRAWNDRERRMYQQLHGTTIHIDRHRRLVLPVLPGRTLACLLSDPALGEPIRQRAIHLAAAALRDFHRLGFTHGDSMAENVMVDLDHEHARWFDFETIHDPARPRHWQRADDVRALLVTCLVRTVRGKRADTVRLILDSYADAGIGRLLASGFASVWRRSLPFHLAQAPLSYRSFREIGRYVQQD